MLHLDATPVLSLSEEVAEALAEDRPVVALETTLLAHGLPQDRRSQVARDLDAAVRAGGAVPAVTAVVGGRLRAGLEPSELESLMTGPCTKASIRDLSVALALGGTWATTVASTMLIASHAGIRWFATGGIGGVHRGDFSDESADLTALAQYPVGVICSGAKLVLDLPRTMERLETLGVPVIGLGTDELPAFYVPGSGLAVTCRVDGPDEVARIGVARFDRLGQGGLLVAQNPPVGPNPLQREQIESWLGSAVAEAARRRVTGRELTPFLLHELARSSNNALVDINIALILRNAATAASIAVAEKRLLSTPDMLDGAPAPSA